jgi:hypothetical protein
LPIVTKSEGDRCSHIHHQQFVSGLHLKIKEIQPGNPGTWEAEAGGYDFEASLDYIARTV